MAGASIGRRLAIGLATSLLLAAGVLALVASLLFERALREHALGLLEDDARSVLAAIQSGPQGPWIDPQHLPRVFERPLSGRYFVVQSARGSWRSRSLWDHELQLPATAGAVPGLIAGPRGQRLLCLRADYRRHGEAIAVIVAADVAPLLADFRRIGLLLLGLGAATVVLLTAIQRAWIRHAALAPLQRARRQVQELAEGRRDRLDDAVPVELQALVAEINRLLAHTAQSLARSRQALGNLGHALKTPLAVLLALAERADDPLRSRLQEQLAQMQQRIGRELGRARTAGAARGAPRFAPREEIPLLVQALRQAHRRDLTITWEAPASSLPLERDDMLELLGNLLDNACKWARASVALRIVCLPRQVLIEVGDDGPGIAEDRATDALTRGSRLDEQTPGHGLGLAIVGDIVAAYHGELALGRAVQGGLSVSIRLPLAADTPGPAS
ncbi:MAG: Adaptive-response sensory-kinase SasA [Pseudomonadales bacterium]|nr:Adaptive-response sensory-kinase SasA [Pseudomonadales bacterium]